MLTTTKVEMGSSKSNKMTFVHSCARHIGAHAALLAKTCAITFVMNQSIS